MDDQRNTCIKWRENLRAVIFGIDTPAGRAFDIVLLWSIVISVLVVVLESVLAIRLEHGTLLRILEVIFTLLFSIEYALRIICIDKPLKYCLSFFGIVDLLSILPTYIGFYIVGAQSFLVIRVLRLLRIFRVFKLGRYTRQSDIIKSAIRNSRPKIIVFLVAVLSLVLILGAMMYLIEGEQNGFSSIPKSVYWAIVTMTTVGYGDITPKTILGQVLSSIIMILGYGMIAVPTGIVSVEVSQAMGESSKNMECDNCKRNKLPQDARFCCFCGEELKKR